MSTSRTQSNDSPVSSFQLVAPLHYSFKLVTSLTDVMRVRSIRNSCRQYLTNHSDYISRVQQFRWYFRTYGPRQKRGDFRLYLMADEKNRPIAYGALAREGDNLLITECVAREHRNKGVGTVVLDRLLQIAADERKPVIADILATNAASIALHEKAGFSFKAAFASDGRELKRYIRTDGTALHRESRLA